MAVADYIFQEETVPKQNLFSWVVDKMIAAGWQQVSSNAPTGPSDTSTTKFYMMKTTRPNDGLEVYVGINDGGIRTSVSNSIGINVSIDLLTDYTPGAPGTVGASSRALTGTASISASTGVTQANVIGYRITNPVGLPIPLDTPISVRYCITKTNVTLIFRVPGSFNTAGGFFFFGLPDTYLDEKAGGGAMIVATSTQGTNNDGPVVCDTPLGVSSTTKMYEATGTIPSLFKSPDASGRYPLVNMLVGDTSTGLRHRLPSAYITSINNLVDRDIIQVDGMNFEVLIAAGTIAGIGQTLAYRI